MNYTIIIPLYNESQNLEKLHQEIVLAILKLSNPNRNFELIYINDGSTDNTMNILLSLNYENFQFKLINHKKNLSQSVSLNSGIKESTFDNIIFLDGDRQNDPADIILMVKEFEKGADLVHGYRRKRKDNFFSKTFPSLTANFFVRLISKSKIIDHGCSLKIIKKKYLDKNKLWGDFHRLLAARLAHENIKIVQIETNHRAREYGKSNYGFLRVFKVLIDLIYMYLFHRSYNNFYMIGYLGLILFILSLTSLIYMIKLKIFNDISFIETPLPTVTALTGISSLIFFSFMFITQTVLNLKNELKKEDKNKEYEVIKK
jgi:glycosyltransferase involved in cell wall biosynthesis